MSRPYESGGVVIAAARWYSELTRLLYTIFICNTDFERIPDSTGSVFSFTLAYVVSWVISAAAMGTSVLDMMWMSVALYAVCVFLFQPRNSSSAMVFTALGAITLHNIFGAIVYMLTDDRALTLAFGMTVLPLWIWTAYCKFKRLPDEIRRNGYMPD